LESGRGPVARGGSEFVTAASRQYCGSRKSAIYPLATVASLYIADLRLPQVGKKREFWGRLGAAASGKKQKNQQLKNRLAADASRKMDERVYFE